MIFVSISSARYIGINSNCPSVEQFRFLSRYTCHFESFQRVVSSKKLAPNLITSGLSSVRIEQNGLLLEREGGVA